MKTRLFTPLSVIAILATFVLGGARFPSAQAQPALSPTELLGLAHTVSAPKSNPPLTQPDATIQSYLRTTFGQMPLYFIKNRGQLDERVAYYIQGSDKTLYFTAEG